MRRSAWSSDVCSSDRGDSAAELGRDPGVARVAGDALALGDLDLVDHLAHAIGLPGEPDRRQAVLLGRHLAGDEDAPLVHREAQALVEIDRSEEHTSELQSLMRKSYAVFCLKKKKT